MQKEQENILFVVITEEKEKLFLTHCHFKGDMTENEKATLIEALINTVQGLLSNDIYDHKEIKSQFRAN